MRKALLFALFLGLLLPCFSTEFAKPHRLAENSLERKAQKAFFEKNGYLWIKNFFSPQQANLLQAWTDDIHNESQIILKWMEQVGCEVNLAAALPGTLIVVPEVENPLLACRAEDLLSCYPELHSFIAGSVTSYIGFLFEEPYLLFKDKINFKWPGGGAFLPHQDFPAYELFGPKEHITAMISIDAATIENGCLYLASNWKEELEGAPDVDQELLKAGKVTLPFITGGSMHGSIEPRYAKKFEWLALETSPCDLVIFNSFIPHYSEPNRSQASRRALFLTHNKLIEGDHRKAYYYTKRNDPQNPLFHIGTPTKSRATN